MRTVQEWRNEYDRNSNAGRATRSMSGFREMLDDWIANGHASDWVKLTLIDTGETGFELLPSLRDLMQIEGA